MCAPVAPAPDTRDHPLTRGSLGEDSHLESDVSLEHLKADACATHNTRTHACSHTRTHIQTCKLARRMS